MASKSDKYKIQIKANGLEILITASEPLDCVSTAATVRAYLESIGKEPSVVILP